MTLWFLVGWLVGWFCCIVFHDLNISGLIWFLYHRSTKKLFTF